MSWWTKIRDTVTAPVTAPINIVSAAASGKGWTGVRDAAISPFTQPVNIASVTLFKGIRKVTGSEKFSASIVSGGDPFNLFNSKSAEMYGARNAGTFRKGVQAGRITSVAVSTVVAGGLASGVFAGSATPVSAPVVAEASTAAVYGGSAGSMAEAEMIAAEFGMSAIPAASSGSVAAAEAAMAAGGAATSTSYLSSAKELLGWSALVKSVFGTPANPGMLGSKAASYFNELFGGSGGSSGGSSGGGGAMGDSGMASTGGGSLMSMLPLFGIGALLLFLLLKKKRG